MSAAVHRTQWLAAGAGAVAIAIAVLLLFRAPKVEKPAGHRAAATPSAPAVKLVNLGRNEAALTDPTPMFLPTEWNAGQNALPASARREPGSAFQGFPAKLQFATSELKLDFPTDVPVPARVAEALQPDKPAQVFLGLGDFNSKPMTQLAPRKAFVEIVRASDGAQIVARALADAAPPGSRIWQPMEFLVGVDAMGMVGPPVLTESSTVGAVDAYFQNYLVKTLRVGARLTPGFYRISVGP